MFKDKEDKVCTALLQKIMISADQLKICFLMKQLKLALFLTTVVSFSI